MPCATGKKKKRREEVGIVYEGLHSEGWIEKKVLGKLVEGGESYIDHVLVFCSTRVFTFRSK
jgi:hypothetical protein